MTDLVNLRTRDAAKNRQAYDQESDNVAANFTFVVSIAIVAIGLVVVAFAVIHTPGLDPDQVLSIFEAP
jgi:hypothetical protein